VFWNVSFPLRESKCRFRASIDFSHLVWRLDIVWRRPWTAQKVNFLINFDPNRPLGFSKWILSVLTLNMLLRNLILRSLSIINLSWWVHSKIVSFHIWVKHLDIILKSISYRIWFVASTWMSNFSWEKRRPWVICGQNFSERIFLIQIILKSRQII